MTDLWARHLSPGALGEWCWLTARGSPPFTHTHTHTLLHQQYLNSPIHTEREACPLTINSPTVSFFLSVDCNHEDSVKC